MHFATIRRERGEDLLLTVVCPFVHSSFAISLAVDVIK